MSDSQCNNKRNHEQIDVLQLKEAKKRTNQSSITQPRWHNQAFMLYLALRQHSGNTLARTDLIKNALALDIHISQELKIPKVFRGKTPMNSASAILTNNTDRYFVPFKPEGSRSMHFKLSKEPVTFDAAFHEYQKWQDHLVQYDWPYHFDEATRKRKSIMSIENLVEEQFATEFDEFIAKRRYVKEMHIPTSWKDLVYIKEGVVRAKRYLPKNTVLGFYFGLPMTNDEFEALKQRTGDAARYAYMYRNTVIDPTDEHGELYKDICPFYYIKQTGSPAMANVTFYEGERENQIICCTNTPIPASFELCTFSQEACVMQTRYEIKPYGPPYTHYSEVLDAIGDNTLTPQKKRIW